MGLLILVLLIPLAYAAEWFGKEKGLQSGTVISIKDEKGVLVSLIGTDVIRFLLKQQFPESTEAKGPTLLYAINAAGLNGYSEIAVKGLKNTELFRAEGQEQIGQLVLECNPKGTVSLVQGTGSDQVLVEDVSEISKIK